MQLILHRVSRSKEGTFGVLSEGTRPLCVTCEDPWEDNQRGISCIPAGTYQCTPHSGAKYKDVWIVNGVPNRNGILIHQGNTIKNTQGCILVGRYFGELEGLPAVLDSRAALDFLRRCVPPTFTLTVINPMGKV